MKLLMIGCGNMGGAIVESMLLNGFAHSQIEVVLPTDSPHYLHVKDELKLTIHNNLPEHNNYDAVLFAVKPQTLPDILPEYKAWIKETTLVISIAAGKSLKFFESFFPKNPIIRVMPNINLLIQKGAAGAVANNLSAKEHRDLVDSIFSKSGYFCWLEREELIDVVIATSGSSPAYFFLFCEFLIKLGVKYGLTQEVSETLVDATFAGSAAMKELTKRPYQDMRAMVTSHKGTTFEAISAFEKDDALFNIMEAAFTAAIRRSKELSE